MGVMDQIPLFSTTQESAPRGQFPGWVYYGFALDQRVKIGYSANYRRRGGELRIDIRYKFPGDETLERAEHRRWAKYRIGDSEWFHPSHEMARWLVARMWEQPGGATSADVLAVLALLAPNRQREAA